ncbi:MAG: hypothetical protein IVW36_00075 [Dehalococcoidia bacterium]|nr:hypothetical protein [Dehalococcoidia bacterium]
MNDAGFSDDPTDQANRFAIVIIALAVIFCALLVVMLAWGASAGSIARLNDFAGYLQDHDGRDAKLILTLGAAVVVLLMLAVVVIEVTPSPVVKMRLRGVQAGDASITTKEIAARVEAEARGVPHVRACTAVVAARGRRVDLVLDLHVDAGADLAQTADAACGRALLLVEQRLGITLAQPPRARLHYRELRLRDESLPPELRHSTVAAAAGWAAPTTNGPEEARDRRPGDAESSEEAQA